MRSRSSRTWRNTYERGFGIRFSTGSGSARMATITMAMNTTMIMARMATRMASSTRPSPTTERGIWAIKWSFVILAITALLQIGVVAFSGSVALLADTIHNIGDAMTAIPLWIAFLLARRKPTKRFPFGLGRVEDLAGIVIVLIILFSAIVAGYQAIDRLIIRRRSRILAG